MKVHEFGLWFWNLKRQAILVWHRYWIFLWNQANFVIVHHISYFCNVNYCCTHWVTHCHTHLAEIVFSKHNFICVSCTHGIQLSLLFTSIKGIGCEAHPIERESIDHEVWSMNPTSVVKSKNLISSFWGEENMGCKVLFDPGSLCSPYDLKSDPFAWQEVD